MRLVSAFNRRLQRLRRQGERGSILILVVLSALLIIGSAGLAVDVGRLYATKAELSRAVDAAALSGVIEFNGTAGGLTSAQTKAEAYMAMNEPTLTPSCSGSVASRVCVVPDGTTSTLRINATKATRLYFMPIFGINTASVSAKAVSGFSNATVDSVIVIDSTGSMDGTPVQQAKIAANNFKNTLLGTSPTGNVVVGLAAFRGCYRAPSQSPTGPMPMSKLNCAHNGNEVTNLTSNNGALIGGINNICPGDNCVGGSGTNVCGGLAKGWEVLEGSGNHTSSPNNRRFMILLSDGDNNYNGAYTYQTSPFDSAHTYQSQPCRPPSSCSNVGGDSGSASDPCHSGVHSGSAITVASEGFDTNNFTGGTGWTGAWTLTSTPQTSSGTTQAGTHKAQLNQTDAMSRQLNLGAVSNASIRYYLRRSGTWATSDRFYFETSPNGTTWTTRATYGISGSGQTVIGTSYTSFTVSLSSLVGDSSAYVRFRANTSSSTKFVFVDSITVTDPNTSSDGWLNGSDNSANCGASTRRERQVDILARNMANSIKADGVEIFVVAFGVCTNTPSYIPTATECTATSGASYIGNTDADSTADQRLLKCIASSTAGTNDHYFYAAAASDLPNIFTTIAAQIAHRLVE